ncbi:hypothetical protein ACGFZH_09020 [Streptomyces zaomyceticus]|uniref:hypothetical protein n=1 Tax=Streptomyces zaomyceticus TaxID=68286 RepID=UPI003711103F
MAEVTTEDLSIQIAGLRHYVRKVDGGWLPTTEWLKQKLAPLDLVSGIKEKLEDVHKEVVKNPVSEYWEAAGFDGIAAGIEKLYEGEGLGTALKYWLSNGAGAFVALILGGIGLYLAGKLTDIQRSIQQFVRRDGLIRAYDADGNVTPQRRTDVEARERRVANGGTSIADLVGNDTNVEQTKKLREQLALLNGELLKFDNRAPAFLRHFGQLPSERKAQKAVSALGKISDAIGRINLTAFTTVANSISRIVDQTAKANPVHITAVAEAIGKLVAAAKDLKPEMIPNGRRVQDSATAMGNLARETGTLRTKFIELRGTVQSLDQQLGGA